MAAGVSGACGLTVQWTVVLEPEQEAEDVTIQLLSMEVKTVLEREGKKYNVLTASVISVCVCPENHLGQWRL